MKPATKFNLNFELSLYDDDCGDILDIQKANTLDYTTIHNSYLNYSWAMSRKRPDSVLSFDSFYNYIMFGDVYYVRYENSIIFGQLHMFDSIEVFVPSHFAPYGIREGYILMGMLLNINCVLMVPEDLSVMAEKIGFHMIMRGVPTHFRGDIIFKNILCSNYTLLKMAKNINLNMYM